MLTEADNNSAANQNAANQEKAASGDQDAEDQDAEDKAVDDKAIELRQNELALAALGIIAPADESTLQTPSLMMNRDGLLRYEADGGIATGTNAIAIGDGASATEANSVALGTGSQALADNSYALGGASVTGQNTFVYGIQDGPVTLQNGIIMGQYNTGDMDRYGRYEFDRTDASILLGSNNKLANNPNVIAGSSDTAILAIGYDNLIRGEGNILMGRGNQLGAGEKEIVGKGTLINPEVIGPKDSILIGHNSIIGRTQNPTLGGNAGIVDPKDVVVLGNNVRAGANGVVAIGSNIGVDVGVIEGENAVAIGNGITELHDNSVGIGTGAFAQKSAVGIGDNAWAWSNYSIALGANSNIAGLNGVGSIAIGQDSLVNNVPDAVALGKDSKVYTANSMALGPGSNATGTTSVAIGNESSVTGANSVALGAGSIASEANVVAVGSDADNTRKIKWVTEGEISDTSKEAINGSQLKATNDRVGVNEGNITNLGNQVTNLGDEVTNLGDTVNAFDNRITQNTTNITNLTTTVNEGLTFEGDSGTPKNFKLGQTVSIVGGATFANLTDGNIGVVVDDGQLNIKLSKDLALGANGSVKFSNTELTETGLTINGGPSVTTSGVDAGNQKITNVTAGTEDADAVNVSQLKEVDQKVGNNSKNISELDDRVGQTEENIVNLVDALGGGATVNPDGSWTAPTYNVTDKDGNSTTVNNVGDALTNIDGAVTNNTTNINNLKNGTAGLVILGSSNDIVFNKDLVGDRDTFNISTVGDDEKTVVTRKITGITDGDISEISTDAINGSQLYVGNKNLSDALMGGKGTLNPDGTLSNLDFADAVGSDEPITNVYDGLDSLNKRITSGKAGLVQLSDGGQQIVINNEAAKDATEFNFANGVDSEGKTVTRKLTGVTEGLISPDSKDAINGSQLYGTNKSIAESLGGGSTVNPDGSISGPSYDLGGVDENGNKITYNNVGDALTNIDSRVDENTQNITDVTETVSKGLTFKGDTGSKNHKLGDEVTFAGGAAQDALTEGNIGVNVDENGKINVQLAKDLDLVDKDGNAGSVTTGNTVMNNDGVTVTGDDGEPKTSLGKDGLTITNVDGTAGPSITTGGIDAGNKVITNVGAGSLAEGSTDAVNGSQINDLSNNIAKSLGGGAKFENGKWIDPTFDGALGYTPDESKGEKSITNVYDGFDYLNKNINGVVNGTNGIFILGGTGYDGRKEIIINNEIAGDRDVLNVSSGGYRGENGSTSGDRTIAGVKDGVIHQNSSDAINGSQLVDSNINMGNHLGGGAGYQTDDNENFIVDDNGNHIWDGPKYTFKDGSKHTNVGDALTNIDGRVDQNTKDIAQNTKDIAQNTKDIAQNTKDIGDIKNVIGGYENGEAPTFIVGDKEYDTVHEALKGVNNTVNNIGGDVNDIKTGKEGIVKVEGDQVVLDKGITGDKDFNIAGEMGDRTLTGVKDGAINKGSSDAINGSQLYDYSTAVGNMIGGGATYDSNTKSFTYDPNSTIGKYGNVNDAIKSLEENQIFGKGEALVYDKDGKESNVGAIVINPGHDDAKAISFANSKGVAQKVTGVADGYIGDGSKEAINGSQLHATNQNVAQNTKDIQNINYTLNHYNTRMNNIEKKVHENRKVASAGIAGAMAMSSIPYIEYSKYSFGMGIGYYDGESAISIGIQGKINDRARYRLQMSYDTQNKVGLGAGVAFEL